MTSYKPSQVRFSGLQGASQNLLQEAVSRNRRPIKDPTSVQGAIRKWINPVLGDLPLSMVDNLGLRPLVRKLVEGGLDPETVNKYVR